MKKLIEYSALVYAFLIFLGYSYLDFYYDLFNIPIYSYLDASEILLSFLNRLTTIVLLIILVVLYSVILYYFMSAKKEKNIEAINSNSNINKEKSRVINFVLLFIIALMVLFAVYQLFRRVIFGSFDDKVIFTFVVLFGLLTFIYFKLPQLFRLLNFGVKIQDQRLIFFVLALCFLNYVTASIKYKRVSQGIEKTEFSFTYDSIQYKSCDSLRLIGETYNYLFVWNLIKGDNYIFRKEELKNLRIKHTSYKPQNDKEFPKEKR